jgi:hypothetical protein
VADAVGVHAVGVHAVGVDAVGGDELVAGGLQGGGEAGPVRVEPGTGLDRLDHRGAQQLIDGEQRPQFLLDPGPVTRA